MKDFILCVEQTKNIDDEIAKIVYEFLKYDYVECIYFRVHNFMEREDLSDNPICHLSITIVKNRYQEHKAENPAPDLEDINKFYLLEEQINKFGLRINLHYGYDRQYKINTEYYHTNRLFKSIIVFDKTGKYTRIKNIAEEAYNSCTNEMLSDNETLVNINPSLTDSSNKQKNSKKLNLRTWIKGKKHETK